MVEVFRTVWCAVVSVVYLVQHEVSIMADQNYKKALYSSAVACLGFICFAVGAAAVGLPTWGYYENPEG